MGDGFRSQERLAIEQEMSALKKELSRAEVVKEINEKTIPLIREGIDATKAGLTHHKNNVRYMVEVADIVSLDEYKKSCTHADSLSDSLEASQIDLAEAQSNLAVAEVAIKTCNTSLVEKRQKLKKFGQLIQFKPRSGG